MANPETAELLSVKQLGEIYKNHTPTAQAIQDIVNYINRNVPPKPSNRKGVKS